MLLLLSVLLSVTVVRSQLLEGDACRLQDNTPGICKRLTDCQPLIDRLKAGIPPSPDEHCSFDGHGQIACCTERAITTPTPRPTDAPGDGRGALARQKCLEYGKYVYERKRGPVLTIRPTYVNISVCAVKTQKLIVGGTKADPKEFPHMAAVGYDTGNGVISWSCGGTLVSESFVLTAAHCTYSQDWGEAAKVRVGDLNLVKTNDDAKPQERNIIERIRHPDYRKPAEYNDIALLRMESPVTFNAWIRPACLYTRPTTFTVKAVATGWGRVEWEEENGSDDLLKVTLLLVPPAVCNTSYKDNTKLKGGIDAQTQICAGEVGKDTCQGDSGGPLVIYGPKETCMYDVIGVTSLGKFCGSVSPGVYTRVYNYIPWLESKLWPQG